MTTDERLMTNNEPAAPDAQHAPHVERRFDPRTFAVMIIALLLGGAWAIYNYVSTGDMRGEDQLRPLVWAIFATPFALFIGWVVARRAELGWAALSCFMLYFFTPFVAARIESLLVTPEQASGSGHHIYFVAAITLHLAVGIGLAVWRAITPASRKVV